eukprot:799589-Pleurochrysis_carterae.AAC.4
MRGARSHTAEAAQNRIIRGRTHAQQWHRHTHEFCTPAQRKRQGTCEGAAPLGASHVMRGRGA